jgi:hypothetical protein
LPSAGALQSGSVADADEEFTLGENEYLFNMKEGNFLDLTDAY